MLLVFCGIELALPVFPPHFIVFHSHVDPIHWTLANELIRLTINDHTSANLDLPFLVHWNQALKMFRMRNN
jgi:hypothetical protein